jgi:nicotinate dehydrogenase subunit B
MTALQQQSTQLPPTLAANPLLSQWLHFDSEGLVFVRVGKVELGQGILTALAQLAAEELAVPLAVVRMRSAHTGDGPDEGLTAGSLSIFQSGPALRMACANARALFVAEAAGRLSCSPEDVVVRDGVLSAGSVSTSYAALSAHVDLRVEARADLPVPAPQGSTAVGVSVPRIDLPAKVAGLPRFISDLRLPGQHFGRVVRPPSPSARLRGVDEAVLEGLPDQIAVVRDGSFLGVVGADEAVVDSAVNVVRAATTWTEAATLPDEDDLPAFLTTGPHEDIPVLDERGPGQPGAMRLRARYSRPYIAHASIAPSCGVARWETNGTLHVWSSSQGIFRLRDAIAQTLEMPATHVVVEHVENAGCYGHNGSDDAAFDAVLLARSVPGVPVQVQWSRSDELTWSPFGSAMVSEASADLDATGAVVSWGYDVWSNGHAARPGYDDTPGLLAGTHLEYPTDQPPAADPPLPQGGGTVRNATPIYDVGPRRIAGHRLLSMPIRTSALRALGAFLNVFSIESFMDELAEAAGQDPVDYRLRHLSDLRARTAVETAAQAAGWGSSLPDGVGRGIGLARYKDRGAYCAVVAEVEAESEVRVTRLTIAVDVGRVVNPDGVRNQIEGGATQATSWALKERVRFDRTRITSDDWESYPILRFTEAPRIEVHLLDRPDLPSVGAGEAAQGPTAAAIGNGLAAAIGVRVRDLPFTPASVVSAIESNG